MEAIDNALGEAGYRCVLFHKLRTVRFGFRYFISVFRGRWGETKKCSGREQNRGM